MALGMEVDLGPGHIVLDGVPAPAKGAQQPPSFLQKKTKNRNVLAVPAASEI